MGKIWNIKQKKIIKREWKRPKLNENNFYRFLIDVKL